MPKFHNILFKIIYFLKTEIWRLSADEFSKSKALLLKTTQIVILTTQGFIRDKCALRASALTFYSLLSVVPIAAMAFGIAKGFGLEQRLETLLYQRLPGQGAVLEKIISFARSLLENTQGGLIAGIGVLLLFWSALKALNHIESTLNEIWKVKSRSFSRKFTDYLTIMIISPLLVIISSSINVYVKTQVTSITSRLTFLEMASPLLFFILKLLPFGLIWLLFILIYMVMPNTRVRLTSALTAGIIAGTIFQLTQGVYIHAQVLLTRYNAIYGSFAALPFFLVWLQLSWTIVLFGAQIAYAHQHVGQYATNLNSQDASAHVRKLYALYILHMIIEKFQKGESPPTAGHIAGQLKMPRTLVDVSIEHMLRSGLVSAVSCGTQEVEAYQPARDINGITVALVLEAWDKVGDNHLLLKTDPQFIAIRKTLETINDEIGRVSANRLVKDL